MQFLPTNGLPESVSPVTGYPLVRAIITHMKAALRSCVALLILTIIFPAASASLAQGVAFAPAVARYIKVPAGLVVLEHVRVIDGTGAAPMDDQVLTLRGGRIDSIQGFASRAAKPPAGATVLDMTGRTVLPGIVGMHDHMYYIARPNLDPSGRSEPPLMVPQMAFSSPHLYLGAGVTTLDRKSVV